jgi:pSer/pThr/pTyr-binding forkhead associated (FHA) protein
MKETNEQVLEVNLELPAAASLVRVTAGFGSAGQKTWNLRRPITLIGSRRPAHIVLHDQGVARAHCVIVNTGAEVLIKDLHTSEGTFLNKNRIELSVLSDGDLITVGETKIQVAITSQGSPPDDSGYGVEVSDPMKFPEPLFLRLNNSERTWKIEEAVAMFGRLERAAISLDHEDVSARHAVVFRYLDRAAVFDLGSRSGIRVNGERCGLARLRDGGEIVVGPFAFTTGAGGQSQAAAASSPAQTAPPSEPPRSIPTIPQAPQGPASPGAIPSAPVAPVFGNPIEPGIITSANAAGDSLRSLAQIETELANLQKGLATSWERLNRWQTRLVADATALSKQEQSLAARESDLDSKDAEMRGQLHDLTRFQEQMTLRERELSEQLSQLLHREESVKAASEVSTQKELDIAKRTEDLARREHVFAQRWSRLLSAKCPHCGKPVGTGVDGKH